MAPKRCSKKTKVVEPVRAVAADASLLDQEQASEKTCSLKRNRNTRTLDEAVSKILHDNFKVRGWSTESFDLTLRNGISLREAVRAAKVRHDAGDLVMGKMFYDEMRSAYSDVDCPAVRMKVLDPNEPEDQQISEAITALTNHRSDKSLMSSIFSSNYIPNQKSLVAMFRSVCDVQPAVNIAVADFFIELLSYIVRNGLDIRHKQIFDELRPRLDSALDKHWMIWKNSGLSSALWFELHEPYIGAIVDKSSLQKCFETKSNWMEVGDDLAVVIQSAVGARIFLSKYKGLAGQRMMAQIEQECAQLDNHDATVAFVAQLQASCQAKCQAAGKQFHELFELPVEVKMHYRGVVIKVVAKSLHDVFLFNIASKIKGRAVANGQLEPLWCENDLVPDAIPGTLKIDESLLRTYKLARRAAMDLLPAADQTGVAIKNTLHARQQMLKSVDKDWEVEHYFFLGMVGEMGEALLWTKILEVLPKSDHPITVDDSCAHLAELELSKLYSFVGVSCQVSYAKVKELVGSIKLRRQPKFTSPCSDFLTTVKERCGYFCSHLGALGSDDLGVPVSGRAAVIKHLEAAEGRVSQGDTLTLGDVSVLQVFSWLLQGSECERLKKLTDVIMKDVLVAAVIPVEKSKKLTGKLKDLADKKTFQTKKAVSKFFD